MSIDRHVRATILKRDGNRCQACGAREDLTIDHIVPRSRGGTDRKSNLQVLCRDCNVEKADTLPTPDKLTKTGLLVAVLQDGQLVYRPLVEVLPLLERRKRRWTT